MDSDNRESQGRPPPAIARVTAHVLRWPVRVPVRTSFGVMHDRPAVLVRIEDDEGAFGWGEAWCNFPACGAEHRARLIETLVAPLVVGRSFASPRASFATRARRRRCWRSSRASRTDRAGDRGGRHRTPRPGCAPRGMALWRFLRDGDAPRAATATCTVPVYASGINPEQPGEVVEALRRAGHAAFKLKVGFGRERDVANLAAVRAAAGSAADVMVDANQAWDAETALVMAQQLGESRPAWLEEPLRADRPWSEWQRLAQASPIPLAAGENAGSDEAFDRLIASRAVAVVQPDLAKWGGVSGVREVAARIVAAGLRFCPHYLGAGIGLAASAHLLAAHGDANSLLEVDANENPLRTTLFPALATLNAGRIELARSPDSASIPVRTSSAP